MKRTIGILVALVFVGVIAGQVIAQEVLTLTTPIVNPNTTACNLESIQIYPSIGALSQGRIVVYLKGSNGEVFTKTYDANSNPTGASQISLLNTANNTSTSMLKRIYQRISTDGVCVGTVTGTPQH